MITAGNLLVEHLFNLREFLLNLAGELLCLAFVRQVRVADDLAYAFLDNALHFVTRAVDLIRGAGFMSSPFPVGLRPMDLTETSELRSLGWLSWSNNRDGRNARTSHVPAHG